MSVYYIQLLTRKKLPDGVFFWKNFYTSHKLSEPMAKLWENFRTDHMFSRKNKPFKTFISGSIGWMSKQTAGTWKMPRWKTENNLLTINVLSFHASFEGV